MLISSLFSRIYKYIFVYLNIVNRFIVLYRFVCIFYSLELYISIRLMLVSHDFQSHALINSFAFEWQHFNSGNLLFVFTHKILNLSLLVVSTLLTTYVRTFVYMYECLYCCKYITMPHRPNNTYGYEMKANKENDRQKENSNAHQSLGKTI